MSTNEVMYSDSQDGNGSNDSGLKRLRVYATSDDFLGFIVVNGAFMYATCIPTLEAAERIAAIYEEVMS